MQCIKLEGRRAFQGNLYWYEETSWCSFRILTSSLGSACYVYGILRNGNQTQIGYPAQANLTFIMDDKIVDFFQHRPSGEDQWLFNQLVFSKEGMNEDLHSLTVKLEPKSLFLVSEPYLKYCHLSSWAIQFDYLKITSEQPDPLSTPAPNDTAKIASIAGVISALVLIGLIVLWLFYRRRKRGVQVIEPDDRLLLSDYPHGSGSPPANITPFYGTAQYSKSGYIGSEGDHEGFVLLAGAPVTGDRRKQYPLYNVPEGSVSSHSLHEPWESQVAAADVPTRESSPPLTVATYAPSVYDGLGETAITTSPRPPRLTIPSSSARPPVLPIPQQTSLYPPPVTAAEVSQMKMQAQVLRPLSPTSPQPMTATTMLPPYSPPADASLVPPSSGHPPQ